MSKTTTEPVEQAVITVTLGESALCALRRGVIAHIDWMENVAFAHPVSTERDTPQKAEKFRRHYVRILHLQDLLNRRPLGIPTAGLETDLTLDEIMSLSWDAFEHDHAETRRWFESAGYDGSVDISWSMLGGSIRFRDACEAAKAEGRKIEKHETELTATIKQGRGK